VRKAVLIVAGALAGVALLVVASATYYHHRRFQGCRDELEAAVGTAKPLAAFASDPRPDGLYRHFSQAEAQEVREVASGWRSSPDTLAEVEAKARRAHTSAVFLFGDMVYLLFFNKDDRLQEFVCLGN
jgi:hypothetical protein